MEYKIVRHPKNDTVESRVLLARAIEEVNEGEVQSVILITINKDGEAELRWSDQSNSDLCYCLKVMDMVITRRLEGEE